MDAIYDRTLLDVNRVKTLRDKGYANLTVSEKDEWDNGLKGAFKHSDMNRIESNLETISEKCGFGFTQRTNWVVGEVDLKLEDIERVRTNTNTVRTSPFGWKCDRNTPIIPINTYQKINDIEKILLDSYNFAVEQDKNIEYIDEIYDTVGVIFEDDYRCDGELMCDDDFII